MSVPARNAGSNDRAAGGAGSVRVMLVDDSGVSRAILGQWLAAAPGIDIVGTANNGEQAIERVRTFDPDVILLDLEMPRLGGIEALPQLTKRAPDAKIVLVSTLSTRGARITMEGLRKGAVDALAKPAAGWAGGDAPAFRAELVRKVRALGEGRAPRSLVQPVSVDLEWASPDSDDAHIAGVELAQDRNAGQKPKAVLIGASTGGPNALFGILAKLGRPINVPILITQHMPPTFTAILAEHLSRVSGLEAGEGKDGERVLPGRIYVAPGGMHMEIHGKQGAVAIRLTDEPPINFCRPSVDPMFRSAAKIWGRHALGLMLTGMGSDGVEGARILVQSGATILVQDRSSSVVWGMPGRVAKAGLASAMLSPDAIAATLNERLGATK